MDVVFRTPSGSLAEDFWTSETGWVNQGLPGGADVAGDPAGVANSSAWMNMFFLNGSGTLAEDYWTVEGGWVNQTLGSTFPTGFTSSSSTSFTTGIPGTFSITSTGDPMAELSASGGPPGITFTASQDDIATLAGTPAAGTGGTYPLTLTAGNGVGSPATQILTLTIDEARRSAVQGLQASWSERLRRSPSLLAQAFPHPQFQSLGCFLTA